MEGKEKKKIDTEVNENTIYLRSKSCNFDTLDQGSPE